MIDTAVITAAIAGLSAIGVAKLNSMAGRKVNGRLDNIDLKLNRIEKYVATNEDRDKIREKMHNIQSYYAQKIPDEKCKSILIMKSETFIKLVLDFGYGMDFDDLGDFNAFQDQLYSASKYNQERMREVIGDELTNQYYEIHKPNTIRYNTLIQKIFFTNENNKRSRYIAASIDFMQVFMNEMICLCEKKNHKEVECIAHNRREEDHK
jgi:hypothetical protein